METVEGVNNRKENWTTRATGKTKSVVQTLLNRQLGLPHFSRHGNITDCVTVRQMFNSRSPSDEKGKPVKAAKTDLKLGNSLYSSKKGCSTWTQISVPEKTEITIVDTKIWVRWKVRNPRRNGNDKAIEAFYLVEPSPAYGLKCMEKVYSPGTGRIRGSFSFGVRSLTSEGCAEYFMTLFEPGILRAYNLVKKEIIQELAMPFSISPGITGYTNMYIFDECQKIFLMGSQKGLTKVIIALDYPPWKEITIIHVDIPVKIRIHEGVCFLYKEKEKLLEVTPLTLFYDAIDKYPRTTRVIIDDPEPQNRVVCTREGRLKKFPPILSKVRVRLEYFGVIDMSFPLIYAAVKNGLDFYAFRPDPLPVYEFVSIDEEDYIALYPFPSATCKVLMCSHFSGQNKTIEFSSEWNRRKYQKSLKITPFDGAFKYGEKTRANPRPLSNEVVGESRPRRSCVNNNRVRDEQSSKTPILGIAYCSVMDHLAILTADEEAFQVAIYDTLKLHPIKALPPVLAWPRLKGSSDVNPKRSSIENLEFFFEAEFMFVAFDYAETCKPELEVFYTRLLSETF